MSARATRSGSRSAETREAIMAAAERLYAEHGPSAVSNRQIGEAAGQGNVAAVGYHFGSKAELVRALIDRHAEPIERIRQRLLAETGDSREVRDWVACLVRPAPEHLASLGVPSWYARFGAQVMTDPLLSALVTDDALMRAPLARTLRGLGHCLDHLPADVRRQRGQMARLLITHTCAEQERVLAERPGASQASWQETAAALTDAITGLLLAPVTPAASAPVTTPHPRTSHP
ncbi:TetR/AcrR family transcriptional regulator [Streptomyces sp. NPDC059785]|uniref:TetR/AcrR family transcriptional regulator n=1 Tax=unclassified Streptomyces TaxID=2593676 RepID=UPI00365422D5